MNDIKIPQENVDLLVSKIKRYFAEELDQEIGGLTTARPEVSVSWYRL
ncbi:DUF2164 family protein [Marinobacterium marinum]|uniref:DUF2164 family protein n=1 Tax=Marinobacterium marinum TaxID=2756129 RepID=A0A7W2AAE4_9GAMM|nr:DUF2164 family protein [Marinobacterium marinum]